MSLCPITSIKDNHSKKSMKSEGVYSKFVNYAVQKCIVG